MVGQLEAAALAASILAHWTYDGWGPGWGIAMIAAMVLFWAIVIATGIWLVRHLVRERDRSSGQSRSAALDVLARRFAEGSIDVEEYRERRSVLEEGRDP